MRHRVGSTVIGSVQPAAGTGPVMPAAAKNVGGSGCLVSVNFRQWSWPASHKSGCHLCGIGVDSSRQRPAPAIAHYNASKEQRPPVEGTTEIAASSVLVRSERPVLMSPMRRRIAERLVEAQRAAALLTTFNEVDMSAVMELA